MRNKDNMVLESINFSPQKEAVESTIKKLETNVNQRYFSNNAKDFKPHANYLINTFDLVNKDRHRQNINIKNHKLI